MIYTDIVLVCWGVFVVYWTISSFGVKKDKVKTGSVWLGILFRLGIAILIIFFVRLPLLQNFLQWKAYLFILDNSILNGIGAILCILGIGLAIWARSNIGKNWSGSPAIKEEHALVVSGPYQWIRHPIYTGMLLAMLGSMLDIGIVMLMVFTVFLIIVLNRIQIEERFMLQTFNGEYKNYMEHTKAIIPYIF